MAALLTPLERAYGVTNIKQHIPIILDCDDHNYDVWRELFLIHCQSFDVSGHLDGTLLPTDDNDTAWTKRDGLVKLWLYGTLTKELFKISFKTGGTAREIWIRIENFFRNNKEARALQLDHDLRTKEIGDLSIHTYCQDLKSIADLLANVDAPVTDRTLVTYLLNGLNSKYDNIINVIKHRQPFPSFDDGRSMLLLEEDRLNRGKKTSVVSDSSSSDKVLNVSAPPSKSNNQSNQQKFYNNRGKKQNNRGHGSGYNNQARPMYNQWGVPYWSNGYPMWMQPQPMHWANHQQMPPNANPGLLGPRPLQNQQALQVQTANIMEQPQMTIDFASAFNTMTLMDPADHQWYMDSGATSHLTNSSGNLKSILNDNTGHTVTVANGGQIPIFQKGSFSFPSSSRPLNLTSVLVTPSIIKNLVSVRKCTKDNACSIEFDLNGFSVKDLRTQRTLLRSDNTGDLYHVFPTNKLSSQHSALLTATSTIWHRRLSHLNNQTLKSLLSSNALRCNKQDHTSVCDACQLDKQIKLSFHSSDSTVTAPFDIVHSDLWTSPVLSLSGHKYYVLFLDQFSHFLWVYPIRS